MIIFDEEKLYFAVFFNKAYPNNFRPVLCLPERAMLGTVDEDMNVFTELSSGVKYLHLDDIMETHVPNGFQLCVSIKDIVDETDMTDVGVVLANLWEFYESQVYFYNLVDDELSFVCMSKDEFYKEFGVDYRNLPVNITNELLNDYVEGKLTSDEYYNKVYKRTNDNIIHLFPKK